MNYQLGKMPLKFAANISLLFTEIDSLLHRFSAAKGAGFEAVECIFPYEIPVEQLSKFKQEAGLEHVLLNAYPGDLSAGEKGLAALPNKIKEFQSSIELSITYCKALNCPRMHIMSGVCPALWIDNAMEEVYIENLKWAGDRLRQENLIGTIEPVNSTITIPNYFMNHPEKALQILKKVNHPNIKLQLDIYHLQVITGGLTANIERYLPYTDHIQIAQAPDRHEPSSAGEINYRYILALLEKHGYSKWIGLEYNPSGVTEESLKWIKEWGY